MTMPPKPARRALPRAEVLDVGVGAEPRVVGQVPAGVVGIFVDDDGIAVPIPIIGEVVVVGSYAEVEAPKPEAVAVSSAKVVRMAAAKAASEAAVFPGMIQVIVRVAAAGIVANPMVIMVNVRRLRMIGLIAEGAMVVFRAAFGCAIFGCAILRSVRRRTVSGDVAATHIMSASAVSATTTAALSLGVCTSAAG